MIGKVLAGTLIALSGGVVARQSAVAAVNNTGDTLYEPPTMTRIIVPTLNEEAYLPTALRSLQDQNIIHAYPDRFEITVADSSSEDGTVKVAEGYGVHVIDVPLGKLSARDYAMRTVTRKGDVVAAVDADTYYGPNYMNLMLRHFQEHQIVGVYSPRLEDFGPWYPFQGLLTVVAGIPSRFFGSNSAYRSDAYFDSGGFDLTIDQQNVRQIVNEEEVRFFERLQALGGVVFERAAPAVSSPRRVTKEDPSWNRQREEGVRFIGVDFERYLG